MPWIIGIDEAGYGPNLGPFVMTSVACWLPEEHAGRSLWDVLHPAVRGEGVKADDRLLIADSKVVYSTAEGLGALERGVLACASGPETTLGPFLARLCADHDHGLGGEAWYRGDSPLPQANAADHVAAAAERLRHASAGGGVRWGPVRTVVVCPRRFNQLLDQHDSKAAVLTQALAELMPANRRPGPDADALHFVIDKHGGRNTYAAQLQHILNEGLVTARQEGRERSVYEVLGLDRPVHFTFQPRADAEHFCVALASMVSKYVRELLMLEFNRYWRGHLAELKPTAGYPGDARRFFEQIRPLLAGLGLTEDVLWRRR